jgi:hypothetical protein
VEEREITTRIRDLNTLLSAAISDGASACPRCGELPHGMVHEMPVKGQTRPTYEIGCLTSAQSVDSKGKPHGQLRSIDLLPELTVDRWNSGNYEEPSSGAGVRLEGQSKVSR